MALQLRKLPQLFIFVELPTSLRDGGFFFYNAKVRSPFHRRTPTFRGQRGIERKLANGSSLPMCFLPISFTRSSIYRTYCRIPVILPHSSSLCAFQKSLRLVPKENFLLDWNRLFCSLNRCGMFCKDVGFTRSDSELETDVDNESVVVDSVKFESDKKEVERVCNVIDETFAVDKNMEAVLDECGISLNHEVVLGVLQRFKHARKPAFRFFYWAAERPGFDHDSRTYNSIMNILGKTRQFETMVSVLEEMGKKGLLTMETFTICIKSFAFSKERKKAVGIFDLMKRYNYKVDVETFNYLLDALGKAKLGEEAQALFDRLEHKFSPNTRTYTVLLNGWCRVKNLMKAGSIWNEMIDHGFKPDIVAHNTMLDGLLRCKKRSDAIKLFEVMRSKGPHPNTRSYTILIKDLCKHGGMNDAINYLDDMLDCGCEPDAAVYTCLIMGFGNQKKMDMVHRLLKEMQMKGSPPDGRTYNALIKIITNRHMPDDAVEIYKKMIRNGIEPSIHTFNMIMRSYFNARNYKMGFAMWEEMNRKGCCPDENSYTVLIMGLIRQGRLVEACKYLEEMIDKGMRVPQFDYDKFKADFSRIGRPNVLEDLAKTLKSSGKFEITELFSRCLR